MESLTGGTPPVRYLPCVVPCKLYFATFEIQNSCKIEILIKEAYTGHPFPFFKDFSIFGNVEPGKKYEVKNARSSLVFGDPTKSDWVLSEVDMIDSGI